jgi:hypothetical protein
MQRYKIAAKNYATKNKRGRRKSGTPPCNKNEKENIVFASCTLHWEKGVRFFSSIKEKIL